MNENKELLKKIPNNKDVGILMKILSEMINRIGWFLTRDGCGNLICDLQTDWRKDDNLYTDFIKMYKWFDHHYILNSHIRHDKTIKFIKRFSKMDNEFFGTIRMSRDYRIGDIYCIIINDKDVGIAKLVYIHRRSLESINDRIIMEDTDTKSREEGINLLKSFYPNITESEEVTMMRFEWIYEMDKDGYNKWR